MKKVSISQSNYIPWKGYFDMIASVDEFVLYDDMQYTRRDWRNRNKIKTAQGLLWLTVPVEVKGKFDQKIKDTKISEADWNKKHWQTIMQAYAKAPFFKEYKDWAENIYATATHAYLSEVNYHFLQGINQLMGIKTQLRWSSDFALRDGKSERLLGLCKDLNATTYISGPAAKDYLDENLFIKESVFVEWMDYSNYAEYPQLFPPFEHGVTILDLIFNTGPSAKTYMKAAL